MIAALLLAAAARADWPRYESAAIIGKRELLAIHVPKAGGTSFFRALDCVQINQCVGCTILREVISRQ